MFRIARRFYYSNGVEHVASNGLRPLLYGKNSVQYKVLDRALKKHVSREGFNERAIVNAANDLGYSSSIICGLSAFNSPSVLNVQSSVLELVKFNLVTKRVQLQEGLKEDTTLEDLFLKRVEADMPIAGQLSQMMSILAVPGQFLVDTGLPELFQLSDDMIYFSVEKDHNDLAWYSKRMAVSMAYVATNLFMTRDKSPGFQETMDFARTRLRQVEEMGTMYNNVEEFAWFQLMMSINLVKSQLSRG
ncbi:HGL290Wp [Eremothecium sinecaudum]|uniref:Ubiquinone biosynthesis protein n=1 Tax=Eremothecium sinecaudum TaxID=45286 RepID=A0A120K2N0_9SACH|nr:HGL290Wp [Eremothecium sinecaudum]AMD22050.1 HGL290Wp [Eremothecium sinecaudum]